MNEGTNIKIPIKAIVENAMKSNGAKYEEYEFDLLRKYFIACLNLGYLEPKDLNIMVNKFASKIKLIVLNYNSVNKLDYYMINNNLLYICESLKFNNEMFYEINFYKAVTEVIFEANDNHIGISNAICEMVAEKIYQMDVNGSRIIMPQTKEELLGKNKLQLRAGYLNYNLVINLLKELLISKKINENNLIKLMYFEDYDNVINNEFKDNNSILLLDVLDKITIMYINRKVLNKPNNNELDLINKYQIIINDLFTTLDQNYFAFCALITSDDLRERLMKKFKDN